MQVNRAAPASTASTPQSTPPASSRDADAYRSDWQPSRVTPALQSAPSVSSSPRADGADSPQQRAANDRDAAVVGAQQVGKILAISVRADLAHPRRHAVPDARDEAVREVAQEIVKKGMNVRGVEALIQGKRVYQVTAAVA